MMNFKKHTLKIICSFAILLLAACVSQPGVRVEVLPRYDALFDNEKGWTGADGAYSLPLSDDITLWL